MKVKWEMIELSDNSLEYYKVLRIDENDFGCEEISEDAEVMVIVTLKSQNGCKKEILHSDNLLYERNIHEGDTVYIQNNTLIKF